MQEPLSSHGTVRAASRLLPAQPEAPLLRPLAGLSRLDADGQQWLALDDDPQFEMAVPPALRGRWARFSIRVAPIATPWRSHPVLYFDVGAGFTEATAIRLPQPRPDDARSSFIVFVPAEASRARLDPLAQRGPFSLSRPGFERLGRLRAALAMMGTVARARGWAHVRSELLRSLRPWPSPARLRDAARSLFQSYRAVCLEPPRSYAEWIWQNELPASAYPALVSERDGHGGPLLSVILVARGPLDDRTRAAVASVAHQLHARWELCLVTGEPDAHAVLGLDRRVRIVRADPAQPEAALHNAGVRAASGEAFLLLGADDRLHPLALHFVAQALTARPGVALIYSDEDRLDDDGRRVGPQFKCELNRELLLACDMVGRLCVIRRSVLCGEDPFRVFLDGAHEYDLVLRLLDRVGAGQVMHLPRVLYHRGRQGEPTAATIARRRRAVADHLARQGLRGEVLPAPEAPQFNRVKFRVPDPAPLVSILIPTRDRADLLSTCVRSIFERSLYRNLEIVVADNGSVENATFRLFEQLANRGVRIVRDDAPFNFARLNNLAARHARGEMVCLLNNDIEVLSHDWLEEMVSFAARPDIGAVGARLWFPDGRVQHAGVILGLGGVAGHGHRLLARGEPGYLSRAVLHQSFSAVTAACLLVRHALYDDAGGLDEAFAVAFNDVDFCLRVQAAGYRNVWTPYAELVHHESVSRGEDLSAAQRARFAHEITLMRTRWSHLLDRDPAYSPNLSLGLDAFEWAWPSRVPLLDACGSTEPARAAVTSDVA